VPQIVGIVNITADSFSDGGQYLAPDAALEHALRLRAEQADVIELGPASSHPDAARVTADQEQARVAPVLEALAEQGVPVSVDSFLPETQRFALARGASYLNDIQGFPTPDLYELLAASDCRLVVMHSMQRSGPATRLKADPPTVLASIDRFFDQRLGALEAAGIDRERLIIDPGLGYFVGSDPEPSLAILAGIPPLKARFGVPVLVSPSRKSFLRSVVGRDIEGVGPATLAAELYAAAHGADYVRTHDVGALRDALTVTDAIAAQSGRHRGGPP
jgi:dihydropteroate synthase type 2